MTNIRTVQLCVLSIILVLASPTWAYKINTSGGKMLRWSDASIPISWYMNMNGFTGISDTDAETAFKHGFQQWAQPSCSKFRSIYKGTTTRGNSSDKTNVLLFGYLSAGSATTAITYTRWTSGNKEYTDADIVFRKTKPWSINPSSSQLDLRGTATHEIGHLLGLGHSSVSAATMYSTTSSGPSQRRFLDQDDINGLCTLYPSSSTSNPTGKRGSLCGSSANGAQCDSGLLCVSKTGIGAYCVELCQNGACPNGGNCLNTTSGDQFCACDSNADCNTGQLCQGRNCVKDPSYCTQDSECASDQVCDNGSCKIKSSTGCQKDEECGNNQTCNNGSCIVPEGTRGALCGSSANGATCNSPMICVGKTGAGVFCFELCQSGACPNGGNCFKTTSGSQFCACDSDADCGPGQRCHNRNCFTKPGFCQKDTDCTGGKTCQSGTCQTPPPACTQDSDCSADQVCSAGKCVAPPPCQDDQDCQNDDICQHGRCIEQPKKGFGETCTLDDECVNQICEKLSTDSQTYCTKTCSAQQACPPSYQCINHPSRGDICQVATTNSESTPDASTQSEPQTPDQNTTENTQTKDTTTPKGGCGCQSTHPPSTWLLLGLFFLFGLRRSRTKRER